MPPPGPNDAIKPMSIIGAAMWSIGAVLIFLLIIPTLREGDVVGRILCHSATFALIFYLALRVHGPESRIRDFIAMRSTNVLFYPLAIVLGLAAVLPAELLDFHTRRMYPPPEKLFDMAEHFYALGQLDRIVLTVGLVVIGPFMEELFFRGALFRPLRQENSPATVIVVTGVLFALVHLDPHGFPWLLSMGLLLGYGRWASGSLAPPVLMHAAFNAVPFFDLFSHDAPRPEVAPNLELSGISLFVCVVVVALIHALGKRSRRASAARRED
jgi:membrane protease YdiL (CAAX protease family)